MRRNNGSALTELGPALIILILMILVPVFDVTYLVAAYAFGFFLHNTEIRELATNTPWGPAPGDPTGAIPQAALTRADTDFVTNSGGMAAFLGINANNMAAKITHPNFGSNSYIPATNGQPGYVVLTTVVSVRPWLYVPMFSGVPGIGADMNFTYTDTKPEDENGQN